MPHTAALQHAARHGGSRRYTVRLHSTATASNAAGRALAGRWPRQGAGMAAMMALAGRRPRAARRRGREGTQPRPAKCRCAATGSAAGAATGIQAMRHRWDCHYRYAASEQRGQPADESGGRSGRRRRDRAGEAPRHPLCTFHARRVTYAANPIAVFFANALRLVVPVHARAVPRTWPDHSCLHAC